MVGMTLAGVRRFDSCAGLRVASYRRETMTRGYRHATDRKDWTYIEECSEHGEDHIRLEATARGAAEGYQDPNELFPLEECPGCGADIAYIQKDEFTEELT